MDPVENFKDIYNRLDFENLHLIDEMYAPDVNFHDPVRDIEGREALREYLASLYHGVEHCEFHYGETFRKDREAMIPWTMKMRHKRFRPGETVVLPGVSHVRFDDKITYHHDFFDMGRLIYERVQILGSVIRVIKNRL